MNNACFDARKSLLHWLMNNARFDARKSLLHWLMNNASRSALHLQINVKCSVVSDSSLLCLSPPLCSASPFPPSYILLFSSLWPDTLSWQQLVVPTLAPA